MSDHRDRTVIARIVPKAWRDFLTSGKYASTRASLEADGSEVPVELAARLEFVDDRRLAIHMTLAGGASELSPTATRSPERPLTEREREVVMLIALGLETGGIAKELTISVDTVRTHVRNAMERLGAHT